MPENTTALEYEIKNSVGRKSKGAVNDPADVEEVQNMLRIAAMLENQPNLDPGAIDGTIDANEAGDDTIRAIEAFQSRFFKADGVISVGRRTWCELVDLLEGRDADEGDDGTAQPSADTSPVAPMPGVDQFFFPFK